MDEITSSRIFRFISSGSSFGARPSIRNISALPPRLPAATLGSRRKLPGARNSAPSHFPFPPLIFARGDGGLRGTILIPPERFCRGLPEEGVAVFTTQDSGSFRLLRKLCLEPGALRCKVLLRLGGDDAHRYHRK